MQPYFRATDIVGNEELQQIVESLIRKSGSELENIAKVLGFYIDYGNGRRVLIEAGKRAYLL